MKNHLTLSRVLLGAALLGMVAVPATAADTKLKFSDPTKPGRLLVQLGFGDVIITGSDTAEVVVSSDDDVQSDAEPLGDGFRRLDGGSEFSVNEADNVVTVTFPNRFPGGGRNGGSDVSITVPRETNVTIERGGPGDLEVSDLTGDLEIRGAIGDIALVDMGGGVLVEAVNGDIEASFSALVADKPVAISVVHGDVSLTVPSDARANVKLRTLRGEMLTNFSKDQLETSFENTGVSGDEFNVNVNVDVDVAGQVERQARRDIERAQREAERARRDAEKAARDAAEAQARSQPKPSPNPQAMPMPPMPPMPAMPPMAGGKLVVGALNGGGTEFSVQTITGDIKLQKAE